MEQELIKILILEIKSKTQIEDLEYKYIEEKLEKFFLRHGDIRNKLYGEFKQKKDKIIKSKLFKEVVKEIRKEVGQVYGQFLTQDFSKKFKLLDKAKSHTNIIHLLKLHKSTRERMDFYEEIYPVIEAWHKPTHIADLCCGINPVGMIFLESEPKYFAADLNPNDMFFLNEFFDKFEIDGYAKNYDISKLEFLEDENFKKAETVFLFKALDSIEEVKKNLSKELLEKLPQKYIVVSFPTKSLVAKKDVKSEKRNWLRNFISEKNWKLEEFEVENEVFFMIEK